MCAFNAYVDFVASNRLRDAPVLFYLAVTRRGYIK